MTHHDMTLIEPSGKGLVYNGVAIQNKGDMLSLTDMWKAAGSPENKRPAEWARYEGKAFVDFVAETHNVGVAHIMKSQRGKGGATIAHWQIALAYAKYLSPEFHMWCNSVVRAHMEGKPAPAMQGLTADDRAAIGGIVKACAGVVICEQLANLLPAIIEPMVSARLAERNLLIRHGRTAGQIWGDYRLPRLKSAATWLGNRLTKMGAQVGGNGRADLGGCRARIYDPDRAAFCMDNGLLHSARMYVQERGGQKTLKLVVTR